MPLQWRNQIWQSLEEGAGKRCSEYDGTCVSLSRQAKVPASRYFVSATGKLAISRSDRIMPRSCGMRQILCPQGRKHVARSSPDRVCACVRACVRVCVSACVRACVRAYGCNFRIGPGGNYTVISPMQAASYVRVNHLSLCTE